MGRSMEISFLGATPRDATRAERTMRSRSGISFIQLYFLRDAIRPEIWTRKTGARGSDEGRDDGERGTTESEPGAKGERRIDNSQDRIVPGAKKRSISKCYRMVETLARRVRRSVHLPFLLPVSLGENCFIRARGSTCGSANWRKYFDNVINAQLIHQR